MQNTIEYSKIDDLVRFINLHYKNIKIFFLRGNLGAGKTTFVKEYSKSLGSVENVQSPTFIIERVYKTPQNCDIHHLDLYRIESESELKELKLEKLLDNSSYIFIEWADKYIDKLKDLFKDKNYVEMSFNYGEAQDKRIVICDLHTAEDTK